MPSKPGGAELVLTAGSQGDGIYCVVKAAVSEWARKQWKSWLAGVTMSWERIMVNLENILEKPVQTLPGMHSGFPIDPVTSFCVRRLGLIEIILIFFFLQIMYQTNPSD